MNRREILSAGVVPVRRFGPEMRFLILRCFSYWDFPKGETEPGEDPLNTAGREVAEETGLTDLAFRWGTSFVETPPYGRVRAVLDWAVQRIGESPEAPAAGSINRPPENRQP